MMRRNPASEAQVQAADPALSTWLSANAGAGKTKVLTDRVARLLLAGTEPQRVLCLTYTKAAASEMQNRLFKRLGRWAMLDEASLRIELRELGIDGTIDAETLASARRLFARAIETPGGLKIQTIHSFCAGLLRRFPIEARVSPDFTEMDDRAARLMRAEIVDDMAAGADRDAVDAIAQVFTGADFDGLLADICLNSDGFDRTMTEEDVWSAFDLPPGYSESSLCSEVFLGDQSDLLAELVPLLLASGHNDQKAGHALARVDVEKPTFGSIERLEHVFLHGKKAEKSGPFTAKIGGFPTKPVRNGPAAHLMPQLDALMLRVENARHRRLALAAARKTLALHRFARAFLPRYEAYKSARSWLDFDDLISRADSLLSDPEVAGWVLFRLDGGIDHVLVDEAQDTSPRQWRVIQHLTREFTAGKSAREASRTMFVVGDQKQSIYSFQGADLQEFDAMRAYFAEEHRQIGATLQELPLEYSFRSSQAILSLVDKTFDDRVNRGLGGATRHMAFKSDMPGRVDLWMPIPKVEKPDDGEWFDPVDRVSEQHETMQLARLVAAEIRKMIDSGVQIPDADEFRPVDEGDFLILVQRRSPLFAEVIRACKAAKLRVAGADRLKLGAELAVKDLTALLSFLATPEDDLSLAVILRSPLFGWPEGDLFDLAHSRLKNTYLWRALRDRATEFGDTVTVLTDLRNQADYLRPFDLIERVLTRHDGRRKLLARLGPEAEDGIDEMLTQALAFERNSVPSLTGFLVWLEAGDVEIKRRLDSKSDVIRVMTVHGAKGLESPIVILPDTAKYSPPVRDEVYEVGQGHAIWATKADESPVIIQTKRAELMERQSEERMRLLYVAMTRAESWLIACAAGEVGQGDESWYALIKAGMEKVGADLNVPLGDGISGQRYQYRAWPPDAGRQSSVQPPALALEDWALRMPVPLDHPPVATSPTQLGGPKALPGETGGLDDEAATRRGRQIHTLLEHLPAWPEADWAEIAYRLLSTGEDAATSVETEYLLAETRAVLTCDAMRPYMVPEALSEVELTARIDDLDGRQMHGTIDRLLIQSDRVVAIDYKSNTVVPDSPAQVPEGILRQMGAYRAMLSQIYPDRPIELAILWTRNGNLMLLDPEIVRLAMLRATIP